MKPKRLYKIIFDAVYGSSTLSYLLFTLGDTYSSKIDLIVIMFQKCKHLLM